MDSNDKEIPGTARELRQLRVGCPEERSDADPREYIRTSEERLDSAESDISALRACQARAAAHGLDKITMEEIDAEIAACRQANRIWPGQ